MCHDMDRITDQEKINTGISIAASLGRSSNAVARRQNEGERFKGKQIKHGDKVGLHRSIVPPIQTSRSTANTSMRGS